MKNINKAIAAGALGVALLAGTAGTFATWQNEATQSAGTITTGDMGVTLGWANGWVVRQGNTVIPGATLANHTFVPGQQAARNLRITENLSGLTINDVTLSTSWGDLDLDEQGFLLDAEGNRSYLRFQIFTNTNVNDWMFRNPELRATFVRSTELVDMYDNGRTIDLGDITVTITQR